MAQTQVELFVNQLVTQAAEVLPNILGAVLLLIAGLWFAGFAQRAALQLVRRSGKVEQTLETAFGSVVRYAIMVVVIVAVLSQLGIQTTAFSQRSARPVSPSVWRCRARLPMWPPA